jgi:hypothetical protein
VNRKGILMAHAHSKLRETGLFRTLGAFLLLLVSPAWTAGTLPVVQPDPAHPGYYQPFKCLSIDREVRGHWGAVRNNCGHDVEAHWKSANGGLGNAWTIPAGSLYSLFEETESLVLGCLPNDLLNRSLQLCLGKTPVSDADRAAADQRQREEYERTAAIDLVKRAAIQREQQLTSQQLEAYESQQRALEEAAEVERPAAEICGGGLGTLGCIAKVVGETAMEIELDKSESASPGLRAPSTSGSGESCRQDPALIARVQTILENCDADGEGICIGARKRAACYGRIAETAGSCASVVEQALDIQRQSLAQAEAACAR